MSRIASLPGRHRRYVTAAVILGSVSSAASAGDFASSVVAYQSGTLTGYNAPYTDPMAALGPMTDNTQYGSLNPFNPPFNAPNPKTGDHGQIVIIGPGGSLTLKLQAPVKTAGGYLGVFVNNGFNDISSDGSGLTDGSASTFSDAPESLVSVSDSPDPASFTSLQNDAVTFPNPSNYWANAPAYSNLSPVAGTILANQSQPFDVDPNHPISFANLTWPEMRDTVFDGSAGGNWLSLGGVSASEIQYVTFSVPTGANYRMVVDAVSAVPEPSAAWLVVTAMVMILPRRRTVVHS